jgi:hypothetical protein
MRAMLAPLMLAGIAAAPIDPTAAAAPCDILGAAGNPCVAAHSTTRALFAKYGAGHLLSQGARGAARPPWPGNSYPLLIEFACNVLEVTRTPSSYLRGRPPWLTGSYLTPHRYDGPLYNVTRSSDGKSANVGVLKAGGFADIATHEAFCPKLDCVISNVFGPPRDCDSRP